MTKKLNVLDWISMTLLIIRGLNWGILGLFGIDVVSTVFGDMSVITRIIYVLVGLSAIYALALPGRLTSEDRSMKEAYRGS